MHVIMVSVGSWGDAEPYLALAQELLTRNNSNHQVDFFVQHQYESRVQQQIMATTTPGGSDDNNNSNKNNNFRLHPLPFSTQDFYKVQKPSSSDHDPKLKHVETIAEIIGELVLPCAEWMHSILTIKDNNNNAAAKDDTTHDQIILSSALSRPLCWMLARVLKIPMVLLHLQPLAPNGIFPLYRVSKSQCVQAIMDYYNDHQEQPTDTTTKHKQQYNNHNEATYWKIDEPLEEVFLKDRLRTAYQQFGITVPPSWSELQTMLRGQDPMVHIVNCYYSSHQYYYLIPPIANTPGIGPNVYEIGSLADSYLPRNFVPDPGLEAFLKSCHQVRPICIGFGSMPFLELSAIMDALLELKMPAILLGAPFQFSSCPAKYQELIKDATKVFRIEFAPYAYLLPQCSMMLCHGGAGVVHATLRAGIPCLIRPIMGDQFLFASLLQELGLGREISSAISGGQQDSTNARLQAHDIVTVVRQVLQDDSSSSGITANCRQLRQTILEEEASGTKPHGTVQLANLLGEISKQNR